ncbi:MAG: hypothetical protein WB580_17435 [Candidatus Binataceae bacterium]
MELVRKSPAGELFDVSAVAVKKLEHLCMTLGVMVDEIRALTVRPLNDSQRALAIEAFKRLNALDPWARALDEVRARLKTFADDLDR